MAYGMTKTAPEAVGREDVAGEVYCLQLLLNALSSTSLPSALPPLREDGVWDYDTRARLKEIQRLFGLAVDGVFGPDTRAALRDYLGTIAGKAALLRLDLFQRSSLYCASFP